MPAYAFERVSTPHGWLAPGRIEIAADGRIAAVEAGGGGERIGGIALPGMPNLHSHAFQRAMAGLAERAGPGADSFWTWREVMYGFVARLAPEDVEAIAAQLYCEMLKAGYTAVAEFHYLHHAPDGSPYDDLAEMAERVSAAAGRTGIALTLLPVLYDAGGFGAAPLGGAQRRFANDAERLMRIVDIVRRRHGGEPGFRVGLAPHSLRAAAPGSMSDALAGLESIDAEAPVHMHIAEQAREVEDCLAWSGKRPVEWLLEAQPPGPRWCLVHATHMTADETRALAATGAVAGLCPTTEANLGDGLFPLEAWLEAGGAARHRVRQPRVGEPGRGAPLARIRPAPRRPAPQRRRPAAGLHRRQAPRRRARRRRPGDGARGRRHRGGAAGRHRRPGQRPPAAGRQDRGRHPRCLCLRRKREPRPRRHGRRALGRPRRASRGGGGHRAGIRADDGAVGGVTLFTIGFTRKSAKKFFGLLSSSGVRRVVDVRLNNVSQLAGFAKRDDLKYFLRQVCGIDYVHLPALAPTREMLAGYRKDHKDWDIYERQFLDLMRERRIEDSIPREVVDGGCLLCSEDKPHRCHRRLVAQYLGERWGGIEVRHLV